ncbi:TPA: hypothetical protein SAY52_004017 [Burkholderia cenocepacia]|uniref:hypothetical protein n=1 Tax=unclassified Burkholderia TaxID=2613784 RepID=UPI00158CD9B2|nr:MULTISPECIES: hypothetical protein [unclassified Burkholderia]HEF5873362.1 hypothetical protein [Burkholderia cenocepacia]
MASKDGGRIIAAGANGAAVQTQPALRHAARDTLVLRAGITKKTKSKAYEEEQ